MRSIRLCKNWLSNVDLSAIAGCPQLRELNLSDNNLRHIDLAPLSNSKHLMILSLSDNILDDIDLSPLASCRSLEYLFLDNNRLDDIDLEPLARARRLTVLKLSHNLLTELDLRPLRNARHLRVLDLSHNRLARLDLWPLAACSVIESLDLTRNPLPRVDVTPVTNRPTLTYRRGGPGSFADPLHQFTVQCSFDIVERYCYRVLAELEGWPTTVSRIRRTAASLNPIEWYPALRGLLFGMELPHLSGLDCRPVDIVRLLSAREDYDGARCALRETVLKKLKYQVLRGGPTVFIDTSLDRPNMDEAEYELVALVVQRRIEELREMTIGTRGSVADLEPLFMTAYGHSVRMALRLSSPEVDLATLRTIRSLMADLGVRLRIEQGPSYSPLVEIVSESFKTYILSTRVFAEPQMACQTSHAPRMV
ncbi:MAG: hypothetical protein QXS20_05840 [Candidatus Thorarchaeota archaeon]